MKSSALPYWLAFAVTLVAVYGAYKVYQVENARPTGGVNVRLPRLQEFELTDQNGQPFRSAEMKGNVWVASFFFSTCPASCARLNANIKYLTTLKELEGVTWISITVDPETDTPERLKAWGAMFGAKPGWTFVTGAKPEIDKVSMALTGAAAIKGAHSAVVYIGNDKTGIWTRAYGLHDPERFSELIEEVANSSPKGSDQK